MSFIANAALRAIPGLFILNSGIGKIGMPADASAGTQQAAASGVPALANLPSEKFGSMLGWAETAVGASLLLPAVPNRLAGAGLATFGAGLLTMYFSNDDYTEEDGIRPTSEGLSLAKDSWLVAIGLGLMFGAGGKKKRKAAKN